MWDCTVFGGCTYSLYYLWLKGLRTKHYKNLSRQPNTKLVSYKGSTIHRPIVLNQHHIIVVINYC